MSIIILFLSQELSAVVVGSNTAVSVQSGVTFPATDTDNTMLGFGWFKNGFTLQDSTTTCSFDSAFPVSGIINLNGGTLHLNQDFHCNNVTTLSGLGSIIGHNYLFDLCSSITYLPSNTQLFKDTVLTLHDDLQITSTITFQGTNSINGNGNIVQLLPGKALIIDSGAVLYLTDLILKNIGSAGANLVFSTTTSTMYMSNVVADLISNRTDVQGNIIVNGPCTLILRDYTWQFNNNALLTVDGVTLWKDKIGASNYGTITFGSGANLSLINQGTIQSVTNQAAVDALKTSTGFLQSQVDVLITNTSYLQYEINSLQSQLDSCCSTLRTSTGYLQSQVDVLKTNTSYLQYEINSLQSQLTNCCSSLQTSTGYLQNQLDILVTNTSYLQYEFSTLQSQLNASYSLLQTSTGFLQSQIDLLATNTNFLQYEINNLQSQVDVLRTNTSYLQYEFNTLQSQLNVCCSLLQTSTGNLQSQIDLLTTNTNFLQYEINNIQSQFNTCCSNLQTSTGHLQLQVDVLKTNTSYLQYEFNTLQSQLNACCSSLQTSTGYLQSQIDVLVTNTNFLQYEINNLQLQFNSCCSSLQTSTGYLQSQITDLAALVDLIATFTIIQIDVSILDMLHVVQNQVNYLTTATTFLQSEIETCCANADTSTAFLQAELDAIAHNVDVLNTSTAFLQAQLTALQEQVDACCTTTCFISITGEIYLTPAMLPAENQTVIFAFDPCFAREFGPNTGIPQIIVDPSVIGSGGRIALKKGSRLIFSGQGQVRCTGNVIWDFQGTPLTTMADWPALILDQGATMSYASGVTLRFGGSAGGFIIRNGSTLLLSQPGNIIFGENSATTHIFHHIIHGGNVIISHPDALLSYHTGIFDLLFNDHSTLAILVGTLEFNMNKGQASEGYLRSLYFVDGSSLRIDKAGCPPTSNLSPNGLLRLANNKYQGAAPPVSFDNRTGIIFTNNKILSAGDVQYKGFNGTNVGVDTTLIIQENNFAKVSSLLDIFMELTYILDGGVTQTPDAKILVRLGSLPQCTFDQRLAAFCPSRDGSVVALQQGDHDVFYDRSTPGGPLNVVKGFSFANKLFTITGCGTNARRVGG